MCQRGLRVNSSSISTLGDPAKGKILIQRTKTPVHCSGGYWLLSKQKQKPRQTPSAALLFIAKIHRNSDVSYVGNCIYLAKASNRVCFLLPLQPVEDEIFPRDCCCLFTSPFQAFSPLLVTTFVTKWLFGSSARWFACQSSFAELLPTLLLITRADRDVSKPFSVCARSLPKSLGALRCAVRDALLRENPSARSRRSPGAHSLSLCRPRHLIIEQSMLMNAKSSNSWLFGCIFLVQMDWNEHYRVSLCSLPPAQSLFLHQTSLPILSTRSKEPRFPHPPQKSTYMPWAWRNNGNKPRQNGSCHKVEGSCWHLGW